MLSLDALKFDDKGLIPAIVTDAQSGQVLTLAYMNRESVEISMREGRSCFYSRSRQELWRKGESSGNVQHIVDMCADCDADAILVRVRAEGPACHTGEQSCFHQPLFAGTEPAPFCATALEEMLRGRRENPQEGSYTSYLFEKGVDKILKKIGEECTEVIIAAKGEDKRETLYELADLAYHSLVLMCEMGLSLADLGAELAARHVIDKKVKQEKMV